MISVPTILVGLGGIGSRVVEEVYSSIPASDRQRIVVHAFDTDVNSIGQRTALKGCVTQTSRDWLVGQYVKIHPETQSWFPDYPKGVLKKTLTDGAGQMRCVSRLGYYAAMEAQGLDAFKKQIDQVFFAQGVADVTSVRVVVVCSLAGGTGAGIFLQTALYLRELLTDYYQKNALTIRGFFLLPDILVKTQILPTNQYNDVRANAYACLKELNAINFLGLDAGKGRQVNIELEYRPGAARILNQGQNAYDFAYLFDYENQRNENIGQFENYVEQMAETLRMQLFSPITSDAFSSEDNFHITKMRNKEKNFYGGAGVARVIYPYEKIKEYCALRWALTTISSEWRKIDDDYSKELKSWQEDKKAGVQRMKPELRKRYVDLLEDYVRERRVFFVTVHRTTRRYNAEGRDLGGVADAFLTAVEKKIIDSMEASSDYIAALKQCNLDSDTLANKERALAEVDTMEHTLKILQGAVEKMIGEQTAVIVRRVLTEGCSDSSTTIKTGEDFQLNSWLLSGPAPLHPVAVRYLLYQIHLRLEKLAATAEEESAKRKRSIDSYATRYDIPTTEVVEDAELRLRDSLAQPYWKRIISNKFDEFVKDYESGATRQRQDLQSYGKEQLKSLVFKELFKGVQLLLEKWEQFFRNLESVAEDIQTDVNLEAERHEKIVNPTVINLLATKEAKEKLWDDIWLNLAGGAEIPDDVSANIQMGIYRQFCSQILEGQGRQTGIATTETTSSLFRQQVLDWCREELAKEQTLDITVVEAMRRSADVTEYVTKVDLLAQPFIPMRKDASNIQETKYWGMHPLCFSGLTATEKASRAMSPDDVISDEAFSKYELVCYRSICGLRAEDLPKFASQRNGQQEGAYFRCYKDRIERLTRDPFTEITPHLDKNWHLSRYMPDLNSDVEVQDIRRQLQAFVLGIALQRLIPRQHDGKDSWAWVDAQGRTDTISTTDGRAIGGKNYDLFDSISSNPTVVDAVLTFSEEQREKDKQAYGQVVANHRLGKSVDNSAIQLVDRIFSMVNEYPDKNLQVVTEELLVLLMEEIKEYFLFTYGHHQPNVAAEKARPFFSALIANSTIYKEAEKEKSPAYTGWQGRIEAFQW
ncbi:MAG: tubulin-like doman-containing protein [Candidatus Gracilibacteria bacterium]|nr:tubulin-like doman-containing protein [Candidatus Gracilibacteria bacterium]